MTQREMNDLIDKISPMISEKISDDIAIRLADRLALSAKTTECGTTHQDVIISHTKTLTSLEEGQKHQTKLLEGLDKKIDNINNRSDKKFDTLFSRTDEHSDDIIKLQTERSTTKGNIAIMISAAVLLAQLCSFLYDKIEKVVHK